ncbi:MAG: PLDc_N domain-containing protein [Chloroflexi bacterium]|nr:MAG: PLDc_N domain-containing protein [Chloroflexota bacterium]
MLGVNIIPVAITIFWIWMLVDCFTNTKIKGGSKILWLLLIFFTQIVGALIYFFMMCTHIPGRTARAVSCIQATGAAALHATKS